jgi:threonine synthase
MRGLVTHLECANCGATYESNAVHGLCEKCRRPLWVRYDLERLRAHVRREDLRRRPPTLWRYEELLPLQDRTAIVSLTETVTPLIPAPRLAAALGLEHVLIKDESRLPTGSFKARGMALAITKARELGITRVAAPSAGNAAGALAAYAARAGLEAYVFLPQDTPAVNVKECWLAGARAFLVNGLINDCGRIVEEGKTRKGWFDLSTLKEPYRLEGKKTMGLELAEQLEWELPDVILYPTGGGTGLIGMWKAFGELAQLGWLNSPYQPRLIACQSEGCAPIALAYSRGNRFAEPFAHAATVASGIRVPAAVGDFMILDAVRESGGAAVAVPEQSIQKWMQTTSSLEGISLCPESAVCVGALEMLVAKREIRSKERIVIFNTGAAQKYPEAVHEEVPKLDISQPINWEDL